MDVPGDGGPRSCGVVRPPALLPRGYSACFGTHYVACGCDTKGSPVDLATPGHHETNPARL